MDLETFKVWLQAINMLGTFALGIWLYLEKRSDKTNQRVTDLGAIVERVDKQVVGLQSACDGCQVDTLTDRIGELEKDVSGLKASAEQAPDHHDLAKVYEAINDLAEKVDTLVGGFDAQSTTLRQILNRVIERGMP